MTALERGTVSNESLLRCRGESWDTLNPALDPERVAIDLFAHI